MVGSESAGREALMVDVGWNPAGGVEFNLWRWMWLGLARYSSAGLLLMVDPRRPRRWKCVCVTRSSVRAGWLFPAAIIEASGRCGRQAAWRQRQFVRLETRGREPSQLLCSVVHS